jgi:hypothetical protein
MTELEQRLSALGAALEIPPAPDLVPAVLAQLPARRRRRRSARRTLAVALAATLLVAGAAMAAPPTRHLVLRILGLRGVQIERVPRLPALPTGTGSRTTGPELKLGLGRPLLLADARHAVTFTVLVPPGSPTAYLAHDVPGGRISFLVGRALITEFRGTATPFIFKVLGPRAKLTDVRVDGGPGVFLSRAPHEVLFQTPNGQVETDRIRLAGNVLLFDRRGLTVRIEGAPTLAQALALARSLH